MGQGPARLGVDIGGTFTDVVGYDSQSGRLTFGKKLTRRDDLVEGVIDCLGSAELPLDSINTLKHGTTQVINTLLERKGARIALVTTEGFRDVVEIGRAGRPIAFDLDYDRDPPLVERDRCVEVAERIDARGNVVKALSEAELQRLLDSLGGLEIEAVAVSLVNAYVNPEHERRIAAHLRENRPDLYVTAGTELSREWYEYERASTAVANAYIGPRAQGYVNRFSQRLAEESFPGLFYMMGSNGGVLPLNRTLEQPIALV
ncbi:MAG: hydantoinase/oxoprolinase family protein, partial [Planctomycetes bacterium]|nr:hydantoinase/oxoprolinase family protein [Planctomycetota bacterium]